MTVLRSCVIALTALLPLWAQGNYEVQVYPYETVEKGRTMFESHMNFTFSGTREKEDGVLPTHHQFHETIEITHGWTEIFETGFYIFTSAQAGEGWQFVGTHIRPRIRAPERWKLPVGVSVSTEFGYQRRNFSADTWTWEIRPIIEKEVRKWYLSFNPTFEKSFHGPERSKGYIFSPNAKVGYKFGKVVSGGLEYYGALGPLSGFDPVREQQQMLLPAIDLDLGPKWEFNAGFGVGVTRGTDHLLFKMIIGRRFKL